MAKTLGEFINQLQAKDGADKKRWLVGLTTVTTIIVIIFWLMYLNATLVAVVDPNNPPDPGAWDIFKTGLAVVSEKVEIGLANSALFFYNVARTGNTFTIEK